MSNSSLVRALLVLIGTTVFEVGGLIGWIILDSQGQVGLGLPFLYVALVLERLVVSGIPQNRHDWLLALGSSWIEYAAWGLWFVLIKFVGLHPIAIFTLVLFPGLHIQHAFVSSQSINRQFSDLVQHPGFLAFSLIEAVGGGLWLAILLDPSLLPIPAHAIIIVAITIEHIVQGVVLNSINQEGVADQIAAAS